MFAELIKSAILDIVLISGIPLLATAAVALLVSIFQTATQIQEQTLPFVIKISTLTLTIFVLSGWIGTRLSNFFVESFSLIGMLGSNTW